MCKIGQWKSFGLFETKGRNVMTRVLAVFIDALKPESVDHMEFLRTFENRRRMTTEFPSYSNTCHASMYTGVHPNKHKQQFVWRYSPDTSPFTFLKKLKLHKVFRDKYSKYFCYALLFKYGIIPYGYRFFAKHSIDYWANFSFKIVKYWGKPDSFLGGYPTIFSILESKKIQHDVVWASKGSLRKIRTKNPPRTFTYVFIGHMDPLSHKYGQDSPEAIGMLSKIDKILEKMHSEFEKVFGEDFVFILWSDHGLTDIENVVDLHSFFKSNGRNLNSYIHFIDSCYARFWLESAEQRTEVVEVLGKMDDKGFILTDEILEKYRAEMDENTYGDLMFYLDKPYVFDVANPKTVSMHGYLPNYADSDGVCISNHKIRDKSHVELVDITPSILQALGLEIPDHMDGKALWK